MTQIKLEASARLAAARKAPFTADQIKQMTAKMAALGFRSEGPGLTFVGQWFGFSFQLGSSGLVCYSLSKNTNIYHDRTAKGKGRVAEFVAESKNVPKGIALLERYSANAGKS